MTAYDTIIIGAGAAGLYCALHSGARGRRVLVLEHSLDVGAKIIISGGGRCNFTNINAADPARFLSSNPHFARSALTRHKPADFIAMVERHSIAFYEKTLGQLFCDGAGSAKKIVRMLLDECAAAGVSIRTGARVTSVSKADRFRVETSLGAFDSETLVIASGALSIPKIGASDFAFRIAKQFGVPVMAPRPGLVPLTFGERDLAWMKPLSGVSAPVIARVGNTTFREAALFTHRGLSGPAILQASSYWRTGEPITLDWAPDETEDFLVEKKRARPKAQLRTALGETLPGRLAETLGVDMPNAMLGDVKDQTLVDAARALKAWTVTPVGTEGYAKAEVTVGGVDTDALSQKTMEVKAAPGLFFIGEAVDVTGWLGGYNFQWAWSSAWCAGGAA